MKINIINPDYKLKALIIRVILFVLKGAFLWIYTYLI